jgi:hypothetical protein
MNRFSFYLIYPVFYVPDGINVNYHFQGVSSGRAIRSYACRVHPDTHRGITLVAGIRCYP